MTLPILHDDIDNFLEDINRGFGCVNQHMAFITIVFKDRPGFVVVGFEAVAYDLLVGVIKAIVTQCAALETLDKLGTVRTRQVKDAVYLDEFLEHLGLMDIARDSVKHEKVVIRMKEMRLDALVNPELPELDRDFIRNKLALAGVFQKLPAQRRAEIERTEDIAAGAVKVPRHGTKHLALRPLATARGPENKIGLIFAHGMSRE